MPTLHQMTQREQPHDDGGLNAIVMQCAFAILSGSPTVTISWTGKRLTGFPRGELLSLGTNGASNYAVNPVKVLAWIHAKTSSATPKGGA